MKLGLRARLFVLSLGVVLVTALLVNMQARPAFEAYLMGNLQREVADRAELTAALAEARQASALDTEALSKLAKALAGETHGSVELLRADGTAVATSESVLPSLSRAHEVDFVAARAARRG
ncbi:MAG TPA: hypothetical protein VNG33_12810, partial [Polyangiaceae bacterium]|nr:hypothetical protein [Polyangiaceae bacterium]